MKSGKYDNITLDQYHKIEGWSKSNLDLINRSVRHYLADKEQPKEPTPAMVFGSAFHCAVLTPDLYEESYCMTPNVDRRTKAGKEVWEEFQAISAGKQSISGEIAAQIEMMKKEIFAHPVASSLLKSGEAEQSFFWNDTDTGLLCKARPDYFRADGICIDLKTCTDATFEQFQRSIANYRYHVQAAFFIDGIFHATGQQVTDFVIIAIEKNLPFGIMCYHLDQNAIDVGRSEYKKNLATVKQWQEHPEQYDIVYPASVDPVEIFLPGWYK